MTSTDRAATVRTTYLSLWRTVPRELGFLVLTLPVAVIGFSTVITLFFAGIGTIPVFLIGLAVLVVALYVSRFFGEFELIRLGWAGRPAIRRPLWAEATRGHGFWKWLGSVLGGAHYWLYLLHTMVVNFAVSLATWLVTVIWVSVTFSAVTFWFWQISLPDRGGEWYVTSGLLEGLAPGVGRDVLEAAVVFVIGVIMLAALPFVTRGLVLLHDVIARVTLGAFASEALRAQVGDLEASRGAAISAEGHSLRRLERDIHDGPQQRLVRLQMDLAAADRQLDADPVKARQLIAEAMAQSKDALEELRALSRGFAPPILLDRGLVAALESAAVRSTVPVRVTSGLPEGLELPQEIERNAYFVASEALANAAKHAGASSVEVGVALRRVLETDDTWLDVSVTDDGRGGAAEVAGHGLAGLDERLRGLGGTLELDSPVGGPTVVTAHLPLVSSYPASTVAPPTLEV
ncbi:sensor histidine kinase [Conyzicola sp.]|uniref:sensor histidine kinase n=1 Tax=Conyzicola sp. TaxID=1969404 RepID=UPI0039896880